MKSLYIFFSRREYHIFRGFVYDYPLGDLCTYIPAFGGIYAQIPPNGGIWVYIPPNGGIWVEDIGLHI